MKKYVVGVSTLNDDITLRKVYANNMLMAMCFAVKDHYMWDVIVENKGRIPFNTTDEAIDYFIQGEIFVSKPLEVNW